MTETTDAWPAGATWCFQGSIQEDSTAGTHVCTLTVTPGAGNEMQVQYGYILDGATATAQIIRVSIDDGTNLLADLTGNGGTSLTTSSALVSFPNTNVQSAGNLIQTAPIDIPFIVSGTMRLILKVSTAAISVTQTFAVVCRIKGAMPTAVLNDTIGTSTNTVNTSKVF